MANALALDGLEDYDSATHGDMRRVDSVGEYFVYLERIRGWVQVANAEGHLASPQVVV